MVNQKSVVAQSRATPLDNLFLISERKALPMNIACIWEFATEMTLQEAIDLNKPFVVSEAYRRYRQIVVGDPKTGDVMWTDFPEFKIEDHCIEHNLGGNGTKSDCEKVAGEILSTSLDRSKPLWDCHLLTGLANGRSIMVYRLHHAITDGQGSIRALLSVTTTKGTEQVQYSVGNRGDKKKRRRSSASSNKMSTKSTQMVVVNYLKQLQAFIFQLLFTLQCLLMALWDGLVLGFRPKVSFTKAAPNAEGIKSVAWTEGVPLEDVKIIKNAFGMTVNDVVLSVATGAIREYMVENNEPIQDLTVGIPFSMRSVNDEGLANKATMAITFLPTSVADPKARMAFLHNRMNMLKLSPMPSVSYSSSNALYGSKLFLKMLHAFNNYLMDAGGNRLQAVLTNVPGPAAPLLIGGHELTKYAPMIPQINRSSLGMGVMSYNGKVFFGLLTEKGNLVGGSRAVVDKFEAQFSELLEEAKAMETKKIK
ncbi:hypothetical protein SARC_03053 [Sphaeroforma arctica JP610]|uniref:Uncharacterized protein n=1 Tax=Sphaeroforma arctica JP610 TaxID=667725 RepID=A0A0L0G780_9EUKA|nr:hypothetical protein SARC_03053 [Sphaeroforma arctica JP610]KNC84741.1 hypothetical protein SARC_03053 [Sphaeroforma arctica JP610]|eukprot:XP_014158643.1 hypothetical protein SARC_03053 [Sphaeroforma arctica JP610]